MQVVSFLHLASFTDHQPLVWGMGDLLAQIVTGDATDIQISGMLKLRLIGRSEIFLDKTGTEWQATGGGADAYL